jgi:hypothetical protein
MTRNYLYEDDRTSMMEAIPAKAARKQSQALRTG